MKTEELISDIEIDLIFKNTSFGTLPREVIAKGLMDINNGYAIGYTAKCCLTELKLIESPSYNKYILTGIGKKYLSLLNQ